MKAVARAPKMQNNGNIAQEQETKPQSPETAGRMSPELFKSELEGGNNMIAEMGSKVLVCAFEDGQQQKSLHTSRDTLGITGRQLISFGKRTSTMLRQTESNVARYRDNNTMALTPQVTSEMDSEVKAFLGRCGSPVQLQEQLGLTLSAKRMKKFASLNTKRFQFPIKLQIASTAKESQYLEVNGEEMTSQMKFRYDLSPVNCTHQNKVKIRANPLNEHRSVGRRFRKQGIQVHPKQINLTQQLMPEKQAKPSSPKATKSFPQRQIKRNSVVKVLQSQEPPSLAQQSSWLASTHNSITVKPPNRSSFSPEQVSTNPINTKPNTTEKVLQIEDMTSTANNSLQQFKPCFDDVRQAAPAFKGARNIWSPTQMHRPANNSRARTTPFVQPGEKNNKNTEFSQEGYEAAHQQQQQNDKTMKANDSMIEGSVGSTETHYLVHANFAAPNKMGGYRKTLVLDRTEIEQLLLPYVPYVPFDAKLAEELAMVNFQANPKDSINYKPVIPRPMIQQPIELNGRLDIHSMTLERDRFSRGRQRVIATQTNAQSEKSPGTGSQQSSHIEHLRQTFVSQQSNNQDPFRHTFINHHADSKTIRSSNNKKRPSLGEVDRNDRRLQKNKRPSVNIQKNVVMSSINAVMKEHDLEVKIPQHTSEDPPYIAGIDPTERQSTQLVEPGERDSIVDTEVSKLTATKSGVAAMNQLSVAPLPAENSLPERIHPIIESKEQELSKYTLKPTTNSSTSESFQNTQGLPSIRNIAAEIQEKQKLSEQMPFMFSMVPKSKLYRLKHKLQRPSNKQRDLLSLQHPKSIYIQDRNRTKYLFTNLRRLAMINDPIQKLSEGQKRQLPEDKSFMVPQKDHLPSKFKTKILRKQFQEGEQQPPPVLTIQQTNMMPTRAWDIRSRNAHSICSKTADSIGFCSSQPDAFHYDTRNSYAAIVNSAGRGRRGQNPYGDSPLKGEANELPPVASKVHEWLQDSQNKELSLGAPQPVTLETNVGVYQRSYRHKNRNTRQRRRSSYFEMVDSSQKRIKTRNQTTRVSQHMPFAEPFAELYSKEVASSDLLNESSVDSRDSAAAEHGQGSQVRAALQPQDHSKVRVYSAHIEGPPVELGGSQVTGIPNHLMTILMSKQRSRENTPSKQYSHLRQNLQVNLPNTTRPLLTNSNEQDTRQKLNMNAEAQDSPLHNGVRASGIRSRATRGRETSQESDRLSITAGKALLQASDTYSVKQDEGIKSPSRGKLTWSPPNKVRQSDDLSDFPKLVLNLDDVRAGSLIKSTMQSQRQSNEEEDDEEYQKSINMRRSVFDKDKKTTVMFKKGTVAKVPQIQAEITSSSRPTPQLETPEMIPDASMLNMEDVSTFKRVNVEQDQQPMLFQLTTLYSSQLRKWQKYDEDWAMFERDHLKNLAPVPPSAQFLLIHLLQRDKNRMKRLAKQYDPLLEASIDSIIDSSLEDPVTVLDGSQLREPSIITVEAVPLSVLEEVYREGRKRLQMCQSSLLFKYNDDKNKIFGVLKKELEVTFESLKQAVFI